MKIKQVLFTVGISAVTALGVMWGYSKFTKNNNTYAGQEKGSMPSNYKYAGFFDGDAPPGQTADFTAPSAAAIPAVVHIKTKTNAKQVTNSLPKRNMPNNPFSDFFGDDDFMEQFFGNRNRVIPEQRASGSGVIISDDGYIVTNNHVVENADEVTITLSNKKTYKAKVIGTDPSYDLAVIKVEAAGLPFLVYGNSDDVKIGQWVLAIGYPLNLETTVTAGIVSAKSRSLGLNKDKSGSKAGGVESFIQTDAAVNMGNSGGALISTDAKLIGINSAIASPTGYYSGYSYAIPVNIVKKVVDDLIKFGTVQRGFLGIQFVDASNYTEEEKKKIGIPANAEGIYAQDVPTDGGAYAAGIRKGDVLTKINSTLVSSGAEMQGVISEFKPGDKVSVTYVRNGKENVTTVTLKNKSGNFDVVKADAALDALGGEFVTLDSKKAKEYGVAGGVVVKKINPNGGALNDQTRMKDGFVILKVNDADVKSVDDLKKQIGANKNITISGFYPGYDGVYEYPLSLEGE
ncbi:MAG: trypsin-like peptidase domain-containing protein [Ferruginibacter sp.]|nr:trypsin-like peptidase domain-containing protein [Ferruginibacter sp.]